MKPKKTIIERAIKNGSLDRVNRLLSSTHVMVCVANGYAEEAQLLIEIEGGVWNRGRHLTPRGFMNDAEKYLAATLQGWAVIRLVDTMLTPDTIKQILDYARNRISGRPVA